MNKPKYYIEVVDTAEPWQRKFWWCIRSRNGQVVLTSENYSTAQKARQSARRYAAEYGIEVRG